jgi:hypothetical protein
MPGNSNPLFSFLAFPLRFLLFLLSGFMQTRMKIPSTALILVLAFIIFAFIGGCKTTGLTNEEQSKQFIKMNWLVGLWQNPDPEMAMTEEWKKVNDTIYLGTSTMLLGTDTIYYEDIVIAPSGINIYYTVTSHSKDKTRNSSFILKKNQGGVLVFEDLANKEQSRITYARQSKDNILLKVEGKDDDKPTTEVYKLKRSAK